MNEITVILSDEIDDVCISKSYTSHTTPYNTTLHRTTPLINTLSFTHTHKHKHRIEFDSPGPGYFPPASSVKIILSLDKGLRMIEEGECSDADMDLVRSVTVRARGVSAATDFIDNKATVSTSSVDKSRISSDGEMGSDLEEDSGSMKTVLSSQLAISTEEEEEGDDSWDMDDMYMGTTDEYVLYTVCDIRSTMESKPRKGLFDAFLSNDIEQQGEEQ